MNSVEIAKQKLQESDWAVLSDVTTLENKQEFITYRERLRTIVIKNLEIAFIPETPVAVWTEAPNV